MTAVGVPVYVATGLVALVAIRAVAARHAAI
jgi:hypothetical protein